MAPRLDEKSKAVQLLRKKFRAGEINKEEDPKVIKDSDPIFNDFNPDTFRTRVNRLKKEYFGESGKWFIFRCQNCLQIVETQRIQVLHTNNS